jgi:hypothetical protein
MVLRSYCRAVELSCMKAVVDKEKKKCRLSVAQGQNPCRWARRVEDGEERGADARNPDLAFGGEAGRSAAAAQMLYASSLLSEC